IRGDSRDVFDLNFRIGMGLFEALTLHGTGYVVDPSSAYVNLSENQSAVDYIQFPSETLAYQAGDCDDLSVLYNAMLESAGINTAFITAPGHIFTAFDLGIPMERAQRIFADTADLIEFEGSVWVPVEVTLVEQGFLEAWRVGAREWRETAEVGTNGFYPTRTAWNIFKPVENPTGELVFLPDPDEVMVAYGSAVDRLIYQDVTPIVRDLQSRINRDGGSPPAYNRIGVTYAKYGLLDDAEPWFRKAVSGRPYPPGEVNLGNVAYLKGDYAAAAGHYKQALETDDDNTRALLGLAKASFELEDYNTADESMTLLAVANSGMAQHYSYLSTVTDSNAPILRASTAASKNVYGWDD
ncbi:MAG: tetratricopeptide repeat protein, partial [Spirochaetaceae bacterium]|nr:tetratricopeptide repeat protein [Spirochaetaceae bacterium]